MLTSFLSNYRLLWTIILLLALFLRIYGLNLNPVGLSHDDELSEIINAKSLAITGLYAPGRVAGIFTQNDECPGNCVYGELGSYFLIPWMLIFPLDIFWSKIPFVLASVGMVFFAGKLFENLSRNRVVGMLAGLFVAINPWAIHFGRTAYFTTFSYLFYILGAYFFTRSKAFKSNLILGTLASAIGAMFYFGTKPIFPLITLWGIIYNFFLFGIRHLKFTLILLVIVSLLMGWYFIILSHSYAGRRLNEAGVTDPNLIKREVDEQRRTSLEIPLLRDIVINKYLVETNLRIEKYLGFFSPTFLFLKSAGSTDNYYISSHSYYYLIDLPFLIFGIMAISTNLRAGIFTLSLILLSVIPAAVKTTGDTIYALRTALAYPIMSGVIAWGFYYLYRNLSSAKYLLSRKVNLRRIFIYLVVTGYILSLSYFLIMYWFRTPFDKGIGQYHHKRIMANYIIRLQRENPNKKIIVVTAQPADTFNTYVFYGGLYNTKNEVEKINQVYASQNYQYQGVKFVGSCLDITNDGKDKPVIFIERGTKCDFDQTNTPKIANPRDGGGMYNILNESLCLEFPQHRYPYPRSITDFQVESLNKKDFCQTWITNPDQSGF